MTNKRCVLVCQHRSCLNNGSAAVLAAFQASEIPDVKIEKSDCMSQCSTGPTVRILPDETWYCRVQPSDVPVILKQDLIGGQPVKAKLNPRIHLSFQMYSSP